MAFKITDLKSNTSWKAKDPGSLWPHVEDIVGEELAGNGIPLYIEVEGWAELACIGETYEHEKFIVEVIDGDEF